MFACGRTANRLERITERHRYKELLLAAPERIRTSYLNTASVALSRIAATDLASRRGFVYLTPPHKCRVLGH